MKAATLFLILFLPSVSSAWEEPDNFKGLKFGQDLTATIPKCPRTVTQADRCWTEPSISVRSYPEADYRLNMGPIGDRWLQTYAIQLDKKLARVEVAFPASEFTTMLAIFQERYGQPTNAENLTWRSQAGASFPTRVITWRGERVSIVMSERGSNRDRGEVVYVTDMWLSHQKGAEENGIKRGAKDL